jgi:HK97 family phage major capsid protein
MQMLTELREKRSDLIRRREAFVETMQSVTTRAEAEKRDQLTDAEISAFDEARAALKKLDREEIEPMNERIGELEAIEERRKAGAKFSRELYQGSTHAGSAARGHALDLVERLDRDTSAALPSRAAERVTRLIEADDTADDNVARWALTAGDPAYRSAFMALLRDPANGHRSWSAEELAAFQTAQTFQRAVTTSTSGTKGGYLLPLNLDPYILLSSDGVIDPIRALARNVVITEGDKWNGVSSAGVSAEWHTELGVVADGTPTLAQPSIPVYTADTFVPFSVEMADEGDLVVQLQRLMTDARRTLESAAWINGSGSGQPTGIITTLPSGSLVAPATGETFAAADVYSTLEALPPRFRANATWAAELSTLNAIDQFETSNGAKMFPSISNDPPTLLRRRVAEVSALDPASGIDAAATATHKILLVGDFSQYVIVDRLGTTVELVPHLFDTSTGRPTLSRGLVMFWRTGADTTIDNAFRCLSIPTTA